MGDPVNAVVVFPQPLRRALFVAVMAVVVLSGVGILARTGQDAPRSQSQPPIVAGSELEVLRQKADQADAAALCQLGNMYERGQGVSEDDVEALKWFNLGFTMSATVVGDCIDQRQRLRKQMSQAQIAEAEKRSADWQSKVGFTLPTIRETAEPHYEKSALKERIKGEVLLAVVIDAKGIPQQCRVMRSLDKRLDLEAVKAARKWRFTPARLGDQAVPIASDMTISFSFTR